MATGVDQLMRRYRPVTAVAAALCVAALIGGCQSGEPERSGRKATSSATASPTQSTAGSPGKGSVQVRDLSFVPPEDLTHVTNKAKQGNPKARYEMVGKVKPPLTPPVLDVFVEKGDVGPLKVRTASIVDLLKLQLRDPKVVRNEPIKVPGAVGARLIEVRFTCQQADGNGTFPCRQLEILVQRHQKPQYGLRYGMPEKTYDKQAAEGFVGSLRVS